MACLNSSETFKNKHAKRAPAGFTESAVKNNGQTNTEVHRRITMVTSIILCVLVIVAPPATASQDVDVSVSVNKPARNASEVQPWVNFSPGNLSLRPINNYLC